MRMMKNLIAYCGLDCGTCNARKAMLANDDALREKVARLWSELNGADITPEMIHCKDCQTVGMVLSNNGEAVDNLKNN